MAGVKCMARLHSLKKRRVWILNKNTQIHCRRGLLLVPRMFSKEAMLKAFEVFLNWDFAESDLPFCLQWNRLSK